MKTTKTLIILALLLASASLFTKPARADVSLDSEEKNYIQILNDYRKGMQRMELKIDDRMMKAAEDYANDMADHPDSINDHHLDSSGKGPADRGKKYGYYFLTENIGWGYETGQQIFDAWKDSPAHYVNMTIKEARAMGVARIYKKGATKDGKLAEWFWVAIFSDEGVERLDGNKLSSANLVDPADYKYKKLSVSVKSKKNKKSKKWAKIEVYEVQQSKKHKVITMLDRDITDKKGKATLFTMGTKYVEVRAYKFKTDKKAKTVRKLKWNKNTSMKFTL